MSALQNGLCCPWKYIVLQNIPVGTIPRETWLLGTAKLAQEQHFEVSLRSCQKGCIINHGKRIFLNQVHSAVMASPRPGRVRTSYSTFIPQQTFPGCRSTFDHEPRKTLNEEDALFRPFLNKVLPVSFFRLFESPLGVSLSVFFFVSISLLVQVPILCVSISLAKQRKSISLKDRLITDSKKPCSHVWLPVLITSGWLNRYPWEQRNLLLQLTRMFSYFLCLLRDPQSAQANLVQ